MLKVIIAHDVSPLVARRGRYLRFRLISILGLLHMSCLIVVLILIGPTCLGHLLFKNLRNRCIIVISITFIVGFLLLLGPLNKMLLVGIALAI